MSLKILVLCTCKVKKRQMMQSKILMALLSKETECVWSFPQESQEVEEEEGGG